MERSNKNLMVTITADNTVTYPQHQHEHWEIIYRVSGSGYMKTEKGNLPFSEGTLICMPPFVKHGSVSQKAFKNISISYEHFSFPSDEPIIFQPASDEMQSLIYIIYKFYYSDDEKYESCIVNLLSALNKLICLGLPTNKNDEVVERIKSAIVDNFTDCCFSLQNLIASMPYTDDYIRTCFKRAVNKTPLQYLTDMRLSHADNLIIRNPYEKTTTIATSSGFSDPLYFSRAFKKKYGVSPKERKEGVKNEKNLQV